MLTIHLQNLIFFSFHGYHEEEKILGNEYEVNASVQFDEGKQEITKLNETINYTRLIEIVRSRMNIPSQLLETLARDIGLAMKTEFEQIQAVNIRITKMHPPIRQLQGSVAVSWQKEFDQN